MIPPQLTEQQALLTTRHSDKGSCNHFFFFIFCWEIRWKGWRIFSLNKKKDGKNIWWGL